MMRPAGRWCCTSGLGQAEAWRESIDWGVLDISGAYRRAFDVVLPHVVRLANNSIDEVRRLGRTLARWHPPSSTGTTPASPTDPPKPSTTS